MAYGMCSDLWRIKHIVRTVPLPSTIPVSAAMADYNKVGDWAPLVQEPQAEENSSPTSHKERDRTSSVVEA